MNQSKPHKANITGLLLLDKPLGLSSNQALQDCKWLLNAKKAGHTGTLDPLATGLLPLCFGEATKLSSYFMGSDKTYLASFTLGKTTDTCDSEGRVTNITSVQVTPQQVKLEMSKLVGVIDQIPPMYSALKQQGKPLYQLAREGIEVKRLPRRLILHEFKLLSFTEKVLEVYINCSSGFYVRSLASDLGEILGCGAHVSALRRTQVGNLDITQSVTIEQLRNHQNHLDRHQYLLPADSVLDSLLKIQVDQKQLETLYKGQAIRVSGLPSKGLVRLYLDHDQQFFGIGLIKQGLTIQPKRLINPASIA